MKILMGFLLLITSAFAGIDDIPFGKVNWSYEVFDDSGDPGEFNHSISKGNLSNKSPNNSEMIDIPLKNVECLAHAPVGHTKTMLLSKSMTCSEKGNTSFRYSSLTECGKSKRFDVSKSYIDGNFCETEKKCYQKSFKIIFSCSF